MSHRKNRMVVLEKIAVQAKAYVTGSDVGTSALEAALDELDGLKDFRGTREQAIKNKAAAIKKQKADKAKAAADKAATRA